jgi:glycerol uptake facilitator protein
LLCESQACGSPWRSVRHEEAKVENRGLSAYLAELVGTILLVLFIALIVSVYTLGAAAGPSATKLAGFSFSGSNFAVIGLLHAFVLMMLIQTLGVTSGGHFNPAVTLGVASVRRIKPSQAAIYMVMQVIGGIAGAALCKLILNDIGGSPGLIEPSLGNPHVSALLDGKTALGALCELVGTFALVWAVIGVAVNPRGEHNWAGFVIGATLGFGVMAFGPLTGGALNPARALGPAIVTGHFAGGFGRFAVIYLIGPLIGGAAAAVGYRLLVLEPQKRAGNGPSAEEGA